jgi:hypothetical protein
MKFVTTRVFVVHHFKIKIMLTSAFFNGRVFQVYCIRRAVNIYFYFSDAIRKTNVIQPTEYEIKSQIIKDLKHAKDREHGRRRRMAVKKANKVLIDLDSSSDD